MTITICWPFVQYIVIIIYYIMLLRVHALLHRQTLQVRIACIFLYLDNCFLGYEFTMARTYYVTRCLMLIYVTLSSINPQNSQVTMHTGSSSTYNQVDTGNVTMYDRENISGMYNVTCLPDKIA